MKERRREGEKERRRREGRRGMKDKEAKDAEIKKYTFEEVIATTRGWREQW